MHNDIKPRSIFLKDNDVFLSGMPYAFPRKYILLVVFVMKIGFFLSRKIDFNSVSLDEKDRGGHTQQFASSNFFRYRPRVAMDDLESLVFSLWNVADIPRDKFVFFSKPEGETLAECKFNGTAKVKMEVSSE